MRFFILIVLFFSAATAFVSCKKNSNSVDVTPNFYFLTGGTAYFNNNLVLFSSSDTVTFNIIISSSYLLSKAVTITLGVADEYRVSYNTSNGTNYAAIPAAAYNFQTTITAGISSIYDTVPVKFYKQLLLSGNYMVPIKIQTVSDYKIDSSSSVIYLHTENNGLSGIYTSTGTRTLYIGDSSGNNINSIDTFNLSKTLIPQSDGTSQVDYADLGGNGWKYIMGFSVDDGSFYVLPNLTILNSIQSGSFKIIAESFNAADKSIYVKTSYKNTNGDERVVAESLALQ